MKRIFTYEEALELLPEAQRITGEAVARLETLLEVETPAEDEAELPSEVAPEYERIVSEWAESILELGIEVKGLWLIDFDSGSGYYCWRYPESSLEHFHGYDEGFPGRVKLN